MRTRWKGKKVTLRLLDDTLVEVTILSAYRELGNTFYRVLYTSGHAEHISADSIVGFIPAKPRKKAPVVPLRKRLRLVK